jgi:hypothetical protein
MISSLMTKNGTPSHTMTTRKLLGNFHRFQSLVAIQHGLGTVPLHTSLGNHVDERLPVADVPTFDEVRSEQKASTLPLIGSNAR